MPIRIRYQNDSSQECTIRPTPLIAISTNILKTGAGEAYGVNYSITLTGTLLPEEGTPYATDNTGVGAGTVGGIFPFFGTPSPAPALTGPYSAFDNNISHVSSRPPHQKVPYSHAATALISKQRALRALFAQDGQRLEITDLSGDQPAVICFPRFASIEFGAGPYVNKSDYTINLEADVLFHRDDAAINLDHEGTIIPHASGDSASITDAVVPGITEEKLVVEMSGAFVANFSESWSIEVNDANGETYVDGNGLTQILPKSYRISHSLSATGKKHYMMKEDESVEKIPAWESARKFVTGRLNKNAAVDGYPNILGQIGSGTINLINLYGGFNCVRTENVSENDGSFSVTENWLLASGSAYENYKIDLSTSSSDPFVNVNINGSIKGLTTITPSGEIYGGIGDSGVRPYDNAISKYNQITNNGYFGVGSDIYKRANNMVAVELNSQPLSVALGSNEFTGDLSYTLAFNNRPTNIISGVIAETLSINDTYPGDVFAVVPVLGRATGPVLQYIGGRTEYKRDVSLNLTMDYTKVPYGSARDPLMFKKPSVVEPTASQIADLLQEVSPNNEPGVRKCFVSAPSESWSPKTGTYSFNISFTYELDR